MPNQLLAPSAALAAVLLEYLYRTLPGGWLQWTWIYIPLAVFINYSVYRMVTVPGVPLMGAMITWSLCSLLARVAITTMVLHDRVSLGTWIAVGLVFVGKLTQDLWRG